MTSVNEAGGRVDTSTQAPPHLLAYAANSGLICRGPDTGAEPTGDTAPAPPPARLLGHFDPLLLGYRDRSPILDPALAGKVQAGGGFIQPTVLLGTRIVGTWALHGKQVTVEPFTTLPAAQLGPEVDDLARFLGHTVTLKID